MKFNKIIYILIFFPTLLLAQHTIKVNFSPANDFTWAVLYKNTPIKNQYIAQGKVENGSITFNLKESATKGIYRVVYAVPQNEYNFDVIYNGKENIELSFNVNEGPVFQKSSENILLNNYLNELISLGKELETGYTKENIDTTAITKLYNRQAETYKLFEEKSNGTIVNHIIKANKPYIPQQYEPTNIYIENLTKSYFENINYKDTILQSSNFLLEKSLAYIVGVQPKNLSKKEAFNHNIDIVVEKITQEDLVFQKVFLNNLWQKLVGYNLKDSANYLAENYLIPIANQNKDETLVNKLTQYINLSIGNVAPDFTLETSENDVSKTNKLSELAVAENYILVFWSSTCSHCLKQIPLLNQFVEPLDDTKYKVIAIGLEGETENWQNEILKYPDFIHVLKLNKWDNKVVQDYGLNSTPTYFILDKDKKFIAKPENLEELISFIEGNK